MPPISDMGPPLLPASAVKRAFPSSDPSTTPLEHQKENDQLSSKPEAIEQASPSSPTIGQKRPHDEVSQPAASLLEQFPILGQVSVNADGQDDLLSRRRSRAILTR